MKQPIQRNNWMHKKIHFSSSYQKKAFTDINELIIKQRCGKKLILSNDRQLIEFISCSYLGLDQDSRLINASSNNLHDYGIAFHSARTRAITENNVTLDTLLHHIYCKAYPVVFSSVHMVHQGVLPLLASGDLPGFCMESRGSVFILDKSVHSSVHINRGLLAQFGKVEVVDYKDIAQVDSLSNKAKMEHTTPIFIADGIGSMGGEAPAKTLLAFAERDNGYVYLDDAHGVSIHGQQGCGFVYKTMDHTLCSRLIVVSSLGKGFGVTGGVVLFPTCEAATFVKCYAPTYTFAGPLSSCTIDAAIASAEIHLSSEIYALQHALWENVTYFDTLINPYNVINLHTNSPIRGILVGEELKAIRIAKQLQKKGFALTTAMYPTVAKHKSILRLAISATHRKHEIKAICDTINTIFNIDGGT